MLRALIEADPRHNAPNRKARGRMQGVCRIAVAILVLHPLLAACSGRNEGPNFNNNKAPVASAGPDQHGELGVALFFDGSDSNDLDSRIVSYLWNFGDGEEGSGEQVQHVYAAGGSFIVTLTVSDEFDAIASDQAIVTIASPLPVPMASFASPVRVGEPVRFDASGSTAASAISSWRWAFGDGSSGSGEIVYHSYDRSGNFMLRLTVEDLDARKAEDSWPIEVFPIDIDGTYDLVLSPPTQSCNSFSISFPSAVMTLTVLDPAGKVSGRTGTLDWSGTLDQTTLHLTSNYTAPTGAGCIDALVTASINLTVDPTSNPRSLAGSASLFYDGRVGCSCSKVVDISATRRP